MKNKLITAINTNRKYTINKLTLARLDTIKKITYALLTFRQIIILYSQLIFNTSLYSH